jgi:transcriptional regulator GlxA family with amidase domain
MLTQNVAILLRDGCMSSIASGILDLFHTTNECIHNLYGSDSKYKYKVKLLSKDGNPVTASNSREIAVEGKLNETSFDLIILLDGHKDRNWDGYIKKNHVMNWIKDCYNNGAVVMAFGLMVNLTEHIKNPIYANKVITHKAAPTIEYLVKEVSYEHQTISAIESSYFVDAIILYLKAFGSDQVAFVFCEKIKRFTFHKLSQDSAIYPSFNHNDEIIKKAQKWLIKYHYKNINIKDISSKIGMGDRNFSRRFKLATGKSPLSYLQEIRVLSAKSWLTETNAPLYKISEKVGYSDLSSFSKLFKKYTGSSMKTFRDVKHIDTK